MKTMICTFLWDVSCTFHVKIESLHIIRRRYVCTLVVDVFFFFFFFFLQICTFEGTVFTQNVVVCTFEGEMFAQM